MAAATKTKFSPHADYKITTANPLYTGKANKVKFADGEARLYGLPKDASPGEVGARLDQLQWFENAGTTRREEKDAAGNPVFKVVPVYLIEELGQGGKPVTE